MKAAALPIIGLVELHGDGRRCPVTGRATEVARCSMVTLIATCALLVAFSRLIAAEEQVADLVLLDGSIVTLDEKQPVCSALAAKGGRITAVGSDKQIQCHIGDTTEIIRLDGKLAIPGFIEGHGHFIGLGQAKMRIDLSTAATWDEVVNQVKEAAANTRDGQWIVGRGWHQAKWKRPPEPNTDGYPTHAKLSEVTPRNPVLLIHASGHMSFANAEAMRLAKVDSSTPNPEGGEIIKDKNNNPTGAFRETAQFLIHRVQASAAMSDSELSKAIELATQECITKGVTSFQDAGSSFSTIDILRQQAKAERLKVRLWVMVLDENARMQKLLPKYRMVGAADNHLTVRAIKRSIDGALGAHGAWLLGPYDDLPSSMGLNTASLESIRETARLAIEHDFQLCVHAIGDRANRETLNIFESMFRSNPSPNPRRWRIEHAQHLHSDDIPRFSKLGVIASMQGIHCTSDAVFVIKRLGQRRAAKGAYVWQSLIKSGATVINGTDAPVEDVDPIACFYASVTRKLPSGVAFFPKQSMTREQALRSYTIDAAHAAFEERIKGSLSPGKLADIVVLSHNILTCPDNEILDAKVVHTIIGGEVRYTRN